MRVRNKANLVFGVGVNDAGYPATIETMAGGRRKVVWRCQFYQAWANMLKRCYSKKLHADRPTYIGCTVTPEWHYFSAFREWMAGQDHEEKHLDKDILIPGNKVYGPDACVFVPIELNSFLTDHGSARGEYPIGVHWNRSAGKLHARCGNPFTGKRESLGLFAYPGAAHEAWRARKHELACQYADMQTDPRIAAALRVRFAHARP